MIHTTVDALLTSEDQRLKMSYEEFLAWVDESIQAEWEDGEVIVFMPPLTIHQNIVGFLHSLLNFFVMSFNLGVVLIAPFEMRVRPDGPAREPDLLFVAREHLDRLTPERLAGPADLIVEVISQSSVKRDRERKFYEYQDIGVREYWLIDPRPGRQQTDFYQLDPHGQFQVVSPDAEGRYHSAVLPGFWLRPAWLWQTPLPNPLSTIAQIAPQALRDALKDADLR